MTYATLQMLTERYGEQYLVMLTDHGSVATGTVDAAVIARALADADALIDGFLKDRYELPLAEIPPLLSDIAQAVAIWKLHRTSPDEKIEKDYKDAQAMLDRISAGRVRLSVAGVEPAATASSGILITDRERPLTAENLKGFI
jgi:phage gp36-like protein